MNIKQHIPNFLTLCNLFCGCLAVMLLGQFDFYNQSFPYSEPKYIIVYILLGSLFFDLLDGLVARALNVHSEIGKQLDSLADMVSFGVVPGFLMFNLLVTESQNLYFGLFGFLITLFSALRLAKFNLDDEQTYYFKGLATPANTLFILGVYFLFIDGVQIENFESNFNTLVILVLITFLSSYLLISNIPLFSLKGNPFKSKLKYTLIILFIISIFCFYFFELGAFSFIIPVYIILSLIFKKSFIYV